MTSPWPAPDPDRRPVSPPGAPQGYIVGPPPGAQPMPQPTPQPVPQWAPPAYPPAPQPVRQRPQLAVVTWSIIALCAAVWLAELGLPGFSSQVVLSPALGEHEPWRYLTSAFAHAPNVTHIAFNMLALWSLGRGMEIAMGRARFLVLYLVSALGGGVGFLLLASPPSAGNPYGTNWYTGVVGASGAVFGLFGALLWIQRKSGGDLRSLLGLLLLNAALPFLIPDIAWQAHVGGFLAGLAGGAIITGAVQRVRRGAKDPVWLWFSILTGILLVAAVLKYALA